MHVVNPKYITRDLMYARRIRRAFSDRRMVQGFIVNRRHEPTLYNILCGLRILKDDLSDIKIKTPRQAIMNRQQLAEEMLLLTNVGFSDQGIGFSLLETESQKEEEKNPNIIDEDDFQNTFNQLQTGEQNFLSDEDTIYELDEDKELARNNNNVLYVSNNPDASFVASQLHLINSRSEFRTRNKYYK
tara:strand:+ start:886 stop:1446 length:561 start_codon:yes stop_codon:yes gene_type:complete